VKTLGMGCALGFLMSALVLGCGDTSTPSDTGFDATAEVEAQSSEVSAGDVDEIADTTPDIATFDAEEVHDQTDVAIDMGTELPVAEDTVTGPPGDTAWGTIAGSCGDLQVELALAEPSLFQNTYIFDDGAVFDPTHLAPAPLSRFEGENAGGSSICSEVMSMQTLIDCEGADIYKTETEVVYDTPGSMTDYIALIDGEKVGVSVTRAYMGPFVQTYTSEDANQLLSSKLEGIQDSTANVSLEDLWLKQILHIWTLDPDWGAIVANAWADLDPALKGDTIVLITVETNSDLIVTDSCDN